MQTLSNREREREREGKGREKKEKEKRKRAYFAKPIKNLIEERKDLPPCDLGDVVERLAGIVPHSAVLVGEASKNRRDKLKDE